MFEGYKYTVYDFPEDFKHENGNYENFYTRCATRFIGHKRRLSCKVCFDRELNAIQNKQNVTSEPIRILLADEIAVKTSKIDEIIAEVKELQITSYDFKRLNSIVNDLEELKKKG